MKKIVFGSAVLLFFACAGHAQTKSVIGTVVDYSSGASGNFEVIELRVGSKRYEIYLYSKDRPTPKRVGKVNEIGREVGFTTRESQTRRDMTAN